MALGELPNVFWGEPMKVRVFGTLRSVVGGSKEIEVHVHGRCTALQVLGKLIAAYPSLEEKVFGGSGRLQGGVNILVNGRSVRFLDGLSTPLKKDDEIALFPPLGGG
jgi:molybdopterin synthase sulfur carrier subunit